MKSLEVFYLHINGEQRGPYTIQHIDHLLNSGLIGEDTLFWREGLDQWQPVTQLVALRKRKSRKWVKPVGIVAAVLAVVFAILLRVFGPITLDGWRESAQTEYTENAAYWRARDFIRQAGAQKGEVVQFFGIKSAEVKLHPPDAATAVVQGKVIGPRGRTRNGAWRVSLGYNDRRKEWTNRGVEEVTVP